MVAKKPAAGVFVHPITIYAGDIDELGHVNNQVYVRWVQEAAKAHWEVLSDETTRKRYYWVVLRHEIDYLLPVLPDMDIEAHTWVGETGGVRSVRHVEIIAGESGRMCCKAVTTWCLMDATAHKPARIDEKMRQLLLAGQ